MLMAAVLPPNLKETELGIERWCPRCRSWWPMDREFWHAKHRGGQVYGWCRACHTEYSTERRRRVRHA